MIYFNYKERTVSSPVFRLNTDKPDYGDYLDNRYIFTINLIF
nr:MAG TPA: hypothetical protein [Bacteriophage sp.]